MDYHRVYREFITDRKTKPTPPGYTEKHHIIPKSLGGDDTQDNLLRLTPEDHFFAHLLLAKMYGHGMWMALVRMSGSRKDGLGKRRWVTQRYMYGIARRRWAAISSERQKGQPGKRGVENGRYNSEGFFWTHIDTGSTKCATIWQMWDAHGGCRAHWTSAATKQRKTMRGWTPFPEDVVTRSGKGKQFVFVNRDGRRFVGRQVDFCRAHGINPATASRVTRHRDVTLCGWRLSGVPDRKPTETKLGGLAWQYRKKELSAS